MAIYSLRVVSFIFVVLAFVPAAAHFFTMFNKMKVDGPNYLAAQRAYDGWSLFGIVVLGALLYGRPGDPALPSECIFRLGCCRLSQHRRELLRRQWEYSHAIAAGLNALALLVLFLSALRAAVR